MSHVKWKPLHHLLRDDFFALDRSLQTLPGGDLAVDISESGNDVIVEMHIPGVDPDKLHVKVEETHVHISGSREEKEETKNKHYYHQEIRRGSFERIITLPTAVAGDKTHAEYKDGILILVMPKKQKGGPNTIKVIKK